MCRFRRRQLAGSDATPTRRVWGKTRAEHNRRSDNCVQRTKLHDFDAILSHVICCSSVPILQLYSVMMGLGRRALHTHQPFFHPGKQNILYHGCACGLFRYTTTSEGAEWNRCFVDRMMLPGTLPAGNLHVPATSAHCNTLQLIVQKYL